MKRIMTMLATAGFIFSINAQDDNIKENIIKAKEKKGIEYSEDGSVKKAINIKKIESYYNWVESADTAGLIDGNFSWDMNSIRTTLENYRNTNYDYTEILRKCRLVAESLKMKNAYMQVATMVDE